jgi:hypothetical protein
LPAAASPACAGGTSMTPAAINAAIVSLLIAVLLE